MIKMIRFFSYIIISVLFTTVFSCQKLDHEDGITPFGEVYFDINAPALYEYLKVKYNKSDIELEVGTGRVQVPEGEGVFQFYDSRSGEILAEKEVNIIPGSPETFLLFQPTETAPIAILDPNEQANEEAAPEGFMKIKIANYASTALPLAKYDLIVEVNDGWNGYQQLDVIESVGTDLAVESYHLVAKGTHEPGFLYTYRFTFSIPGTEEIVLNGRGTVYTNGGSWSYPTPKPEKDVFTMFLSENKDRELEGATNAQKGRGIPVDGFLYSTSVNSLFED